MPAADPVEPMALPHVLVVNDDPALRERTSVPIVLPTGKAEGADDHVTKPFSPREPLARIRSVLRRSQRTARAALNNAEVFDRTVDVQVLRLRRKLEADPFHPRLIATERGAGYRFDTPVETLV